MLSEHNRVQKYWQAHRLGGLYEHIFRYIVYKIKVHQTQVEYSKQKGHNLSSNINNRALWKFVNFSTTEDAVT